MNYKEEQQKAREASRPRRNEELSKSPSWRKRVRSKMVDRHFTKKGYAYGLKIGSRNYNLIHAIAKRQAPK